MYAPLLHNEALVLQQVARGDEQAFRRLFGIYHQPLAVHIHRLTESVELTEEIVQDVFLKIWMSREALTEVRHFSAFLFVLSKNHALNALRKIARERVRYRTWAAEQEEQSGEEQDNGFYYSLIDRAIQQLPPQQQKVYTLSRRQGLKYREIAAQMGISPETVKKYLQLAIASITEYVRNNIAVFLVLSGLALFQ